MEAGSGVRNDLRPYEKRRNTDVNTQRKMQVTLALHRCKPGKPRIAENVQKLRERLRTDFSLRALQKELNQ
jgi:hypothetical protein